MKGSEIRKKFLDYFERKDHKLLQSSSLIPSDPTVLLTLAGMLQFKPIFLGKEKPAYKRAATCQKCVRTIDIDNVGKTPRHHTFFEMLGNFSFGDYFKKEAISFAYELLTKEFGIPIEKLFVAIHEKDDEAFNIWKDEVGFPQAKIYRLGDDNNFWAAGPTGPCGPCSEIYYDTGKDKNCKNPDCKPGCDCNRFLEIWNLVFVEFNRDESGKLLILPSKNIDTGMGLERIASVLQGAKSNFDTDLLRPIVDALIKMIPKAIQYKNDQIYVISDHVRAITYLIADGVLPSNEGRGYVLRRLIRRCERIGKILTLSEGFLIKLSKKVIDLGKDFYPELSKKEKEISKILKIEEDNFRSTLDQGLKLLSDIMQTYSNSKKIPGKEAFVLHDTYGFPFELTKEIALENGYEIEDKGFEEEMNKQKEKAREAGISKTAGLDISKLKLDKYGKTKFVGYDTLVAETKIIDVFNENNLVILEKTPFYPEGGGQVGDVGSLEFNDKTIKVLGTYGDIGKTIVHNVENTAMLEKGMNVKAVVDSGRRYATAIHHSATHLLHAALRSLFGEEARQTGSFVSPEYLRFDFVHFEALSEDELMKIEMFVNDKIKQNLHVDVLETSLNEAKKMGAVALFNEKYGEKVRMCKMGDVSMELCGGTHVKSTGQIEMFKIKKEESVAQGVRRIEAVAGSPVIEYILNELEKYRKENIELLAKLKKNEYIKQGLGGAPLLDFDIFEITLEEQNIVKKALRDKDIIALKKFLDHLDERNGRLKDRITNIEKEIRRLLFNRSSEEVGKLSMKARDINGVKVVVENLEQEYTNDILRNIADGIRSALKTCVILLTAVSADNKVMIIANISDDLVQKGLNAGNLVKEVAQIVGGSGGGKPTLAEAGGKDKTKIKEALDKALQIIQEILGKA